MTNCPVCHGEPEGCRYCDETGVVYNYEPSFSSAITAAFRQEKRKQLKQTLVTYLPNGSKLYSGRIIDGQQQ